MQLVEGLRELLLIEGIFGFALARGRLIELVHQGLARRTGLRFRELGHLLKQLLIAGCRQCLGGADAFRSDWVTAYRRLRALPRSDVAKAICAIDELVSASEAYKSVSSANTVYCVAR